MELSVLLEEALDVLYPTGTGDTKLIAVDAIRSRRKEVISLGELPSVHAANGAGPCLGYLESDQSGIGAIMPLPTAAVSPRAYVEGDAHILENADFRMAVSNGRITSIVDRALQRELIKPASGAETAGLMLYSDLPLSYDAWDAEIYHLNCGIEVAFTCVEVLAVSPLRATLRAIARFGKSTATLDVGCRPSSLTPDLSRCFNPIIDRAQLLPYRRYS